MWWCGGGGDRNGPVRQLWQQTSPKLIFSGMRSTLRSMQTISCGHCRGHIEYHPEWAGQTMQCPHCGSNFTMPGAVVSELVPAPLPQLAPILLQPQQQPPLVIVTGPKSQARLHTGGWFARSFVSTCGILLALALFFGGSKKVTVFTLAAQVVMQTASYAHLSFNSEWPRLAKSRLGKYDR
jgi:hypothetical protein